MSEPAAAPTRIPPLEWRFIYAAIVLVAAALLLRAVAPVLSPVVLYLLLLLLLSPYSGSREHRLVVVAATLLFALWLLNALGSILAPFLVAFTLAYLLDPAADALQRRGLSRGVAVAVLLVPILALLALGLTFGLPALAQQAGDLVGKIPKALASAAGSLEHLRQRIEHMNLPFRSGQTIARQLVIDEAKIAEFIQSQQQAILQRAWATVLGVGKGFGFVLTLLGYLVLTPVLVAYLLRDFNRMSQRAWALVPPSRSEYWLRLAREYDQLLSRFVRGQVIEAALVGLFTWFGLMVLGFPYSGLVGAIAGVFNLVPYLGLIVSIIPVIIIALLSGSFLASLGKAGAVFLVVQLIDSSITGPRIVGSSVGLHPVWVMLALAVGSFFFGFVGLLLAMPAAVLIKLALRETLARYGRSDITVDPAAE